MAQRHRLSLLVLAVLTAFLAACAGTIDQTITFRSDEAWETTATAAYPAEIAPLVAGQLDAELSRIEQAIEAGGGDMRWERADEDDGGLTYDIEASGRGYDILSSISFSDMSVTVVEQDGRRELTFTATPPLDAAANTLTVIGGEILSANGAIDGDRVTWVNSRSLMEAVLTERGGAGSLPWLPLLGGLALVTVGALLAWYLLRRRAAPAPAAAPALPGYAPIPPGAAPSPPMSPPAAPPTSAPPAAARGIVAPGAAPATRFCVRCGAKLRPTARFCATCGQAQPE